MIERIWSTNRKELRMGFIVFRYFFVVMKNLTGGKISFNRVENGGFLLSTDNDEPWEET